MWQIGIWVAIMTFIALDKFIIVLYLGIALLWCELVTIERVLKNGK